MRSGVAPSLRLEFFDMKRKALLLGVSVAGLLALAPMRAEAFACANCTQEATEIFRDIKRGIEFAKQLAETKRMVEYHIESWRALAEVRNFGQLTGALGRLSGSYYPDGRELVSAMRDGQSIARSLGSGDASSLDRILSRGTISRLERTWGTAERWYDAMEGQQHVVAFGRQTSLTAIERAQEALVALRQAEHQLSRNRGIAEITAGLTAINLAQVHTAQNALQLQAIGVRLQTEAMQSGIAREERMRREDLENAATHNWAFEAARRVTR